MNSIKVHLDSRNRVPLTKLLGECSAKTFDAYWEEGKLVLIPLVEIPESEVWIYRNKRVLDSLERGLQDAAEGKTSPLDLSSLPNVVDDE